MQPDQKEKPKIEVSKCLTNAPSTSSPPTLRKRLQLKSLDSVTDSKLSTRIYATSKKNRSAEDFKRSSSRDSSSDFDGEFGGDHIAKNIFYKNEEKSQLICFKDHKKIIAIKNDSSKFTKYNTFDLKLNDHRKSKIVKYKSLDSTPEPTTLVKYYDKKSNVSISAQDFHYSEFKLPNYERKKAPKNDIITNTVDAWAKKNSAVFANLKNSIFKNNKPTKEVIYKPLIFGGTYPIDMPFQKVDKRQQHLQQIPVKREPQKFRQYGPPKTFDIDRPI